MKMVVYVATEIIVTMKPRSCADENAAVKPFRAVVACRGAGVRRHVIVAIWAIGRYSD
jgi:hypothetical protein